MSTPARFVILLALAAVTVCPRASAAAEVNFMTDFGYYGRQACFYVALDKSYYRAEGLDVNILRGQGPHARVVNSLAPRINA